MLCWVNFGSVWVARFNVFQIEFRCQLLTIWYQIRLLVGCRLVLPCRHRRPSRTKSLTFDFEQHSFYSLWFLDLGRRLGIANIKIKRPPRTNSICRVFNSTAGERYKPRCLNVEAYVANKMQLYSCHKDGDTKIQTKKNAPTNRKWRGAGNRQMQQA